MTVKSERQASLRQRIRADGLRATSSRVAVLDHLETMGRPLTHGEVAAALDDAGFDRATVYRNLIDLADAGVARRSDFGDHVWRFELSHHQDEESHVHFMCKVCGDVECLPNDTVVVKARRGSPRALSGDFEINITGTCDQCA